MRFIDITLSVCEDFKAYLLSGPKLREAWAGMDAKYRYQLEEEALKAVEKQLAHAQAELNKAQIKLRSLQSGLAAASAAALAG